VRQLPLAVRLRERAVFDSFVVGANRSSVEQLRALEREGSAGVYWLYGVSGVGKSHLLQASCAQASRLGQQAAYLPLSQLRTLGIGTLEGWQDARLLALDELALVVGEPEWERALFGLHREIEERHALLIVAATEPPQRLRFALPDLASRFAAATLLPLRVLDEDEQREALRLRALARGLELPEETALYLQRRFPRDLPTLYGLLDTIDEAALRAQRRLTLPFIRQVLGEQTPGAG